MPKLVVNGAQLKCSEGSSSSALKVLQSAPADADTQPVATVLDHLPIVNVAPFGMCKAMANPQVAAATAAAQGTLTPVPCVPVIPAPWTPGASVVTVDEIPALTDGSTCSCAWTGTCEVSQPGSDIEVD